MDKRVTPISWLTDVKSRAPHQSIDDDIILFSAFSFADISTFMHPCKFDMLFMTVCTKGTASGMIDMQFYDLKSPFVMVIRPGQILQCKAISSDFSGYCLVLSNHFATEILPDVDKRLAITAAVRQNPYAQLFPDNMAYVRNYFLTLKKVMAMKDNPCRLEIVKHLTMAFFYAVNPYFQPPARTVTAAQTRQTLLAEQFRVLVAEHYRTERETVYYASRLCLTPKYLSQVIKSITGKTASEWIDDYVILEARALLKSTNMTVQQIADALHFPSQSFFGKYFKRHVGLSPRKYRRIE